MAKISCFPTLRIRSKRRKRWKITKSQLDRIIKEAIQEVLDNDAEDTRVEDTRVEDAAPTRVDPNTLGAKAAHQRYLRSTGQRYALDRSNKTITRATSPSRADLNSLADDAIGRINKQEKESKTRARTGSPVGRYRDLASSIVGRWKSARNRRLRGRPRSRRAMRNINEESITKSKLLELIREELKSLK